MQNLQNDKIKNKIQFSKTPNFQKTQNLKKTTQKIQNFPFKKNKNPKLPIFLSYCHENMYIYRVCYSQSPSDKI